MTDLSLYVPAREPNVTARCDAIDNLVTIRETTEEDIESRPWPEVDMQLMNEILKAGLNVSIKRVTEKTPDIQEEFE
jgi:hypothetical protein